MIVSTKGRYALRVMIDLAEHQAERYEMCIRDRACTRVQVPSGPTS